MKRLLGFIVAILVVVPSVAGAVPVRLDNQGVGLEYMTEPVTGAWDIGSLADATDTEDLSQYWSDASSKQDIDIVNDGQYMFYVNNRDTVYRFTFSDPGNLGEGITKSQEVDYVGVDGSSVGDNITGLYITENGDTLIISDRNNITKFSLSPSYDLTNPTFVQDSPIPSGATDLKSLTFGENGNNLYFREGFYTVYWQTLSSYDLSTITTSDTYTESDFGHTAIRSLTIKPDGSIFYVNGYPTDLDEYAFEEFELSTNYDLNTREAGDVATYISNSGEASSWGYLGNDFYNVGGSSQYILQEYPATN